MLLHMPANIVLYDKNQIIIIIGVALNTGE